MKKEIKGFIKLLYGHTNPFPESINYISVNWIDKYSESIIKLLHISSSCKKIRNAKSNKLKV